MFSFSAAGSEPLQLKPDSKKKPWPVRWNRTSLLRSELTFRYSMLSFIHRDEKLRWCYQRISCNLRIFESVWLSIGSPYQFGSAAEWSRCFKKADSGWSRHTERKRRTPSFEAVIIWSGIIQGFFAFLEMDEKAAIAVRVVSDDFFWRLPSKFILTSHRLFEEQWRKLTYTYSIFSRVTPHSVGR